MKTVSLPIFTAVVMTAGSAIAQDNPRGSPDRFYKDAELQLAFGTEGIGAEGRRSRDQHAAITTLTLMSGPFAGSETEHVRFGATLQADEEGDLFLGVGPEFQLVLGKFRAEFGVMVGGYYGGEDDLGSNHMFRPYLGMSYQVAEKLRLGIMTDHKSNLDTGDTNPGVDTVNIVFMYQF